MNSWIKSKKHSIETRKKLSDWHKGKKLSEETKKKISQANKGKKRSAETRKKISESHKGLPSPMKGKKRSAETRKKMSESHKGLPSPMKGRHHSEETKRKIIESDTLFKKGHIPWMKGKHHSEKSKRKNSESKKKWYDSGGKSWNKGKKIPPTKNQLKQLKKLHESLKGRKVSEETKKKISQANKGKKRSAEIIKKISEAHKNPSAEARRKMSVSAKRRYLTDPGLRKKLSESHKGKKQSADTIAKRVESRRWYKPSEETKRKMSLVQKGRKPNPEAVRKMTITLNTPEAKSKRRELRLHQKFPKNDTIPEKMMQLALTLQGIEFEKHKPIIGQPDIFIQPNICVFVDGDYWHANPKKFKSDKILTGGKTAKERWEKDARINHELNKQGYHVIRIWESDVRSDASRCAKNILHLIKQIMTARNNLKKSARTHLFRD